MLQQLLNTTSYSQTRNSRFKSSKSHYVSVAQRWDETYSALTEQNQQLVDFYLESAKAEFVRRHPTLKKWSDMRLAEAKDVIMQKVEIDTTMQRQLNMVWVLEIIQSFLETMVVPIQVYKPEDKPDTYLAWDGQHTVMALWLIATHIFDEDPNEITIPVNVYPSSLKSEMRGNFIKLNSKEGKKQLELIDIYEQQVFGVEVDRSNNPEWIKTAEKQSYIAQAGLFVTAKKFGDTDQPGAISRLNEIIKLAPESVKHLADYLALSTKLMRPVEEKEIVMMAHFFDRVRINNEIRKGHKFKHLPEIKVDKKYIVDLALTLDRAFKCDFSPNSVFWMKAGTAYRNWHNKTFNGAQSRFLKEPSHGFPFLIAQLEKDFPHPIPENDKGEFYPAKKDLF